MKVFTKLKNKHVLAALLLALVIAPWDSLRAQERSTAYAPGSSPSTSNWGTHHSPFGYPSAQDHNSDNTWGYAAYCYAASTVHWTGNITNIAFMPDYDCDVTDGRKYSIYMMDKPSGYGFSWYQSFDDLIAEATCVLSNASVPTSFTGESWKDISLNTSSFAHYQEHDLIVIVKVTGMNDGGEATVCVSTLGDNTHVLHANSAEQSGTSQLCNQLPYIRFTYGTAYSVTIKPNNTSYGKVRFGSSGSYTAGTLVKAVAAGGSVYISASANSGYSFSNWTGYATLTSASTTVSSINQNRTYTANFTSGGGGGGGGSDVTAMTCGTDYSGTLSSSGGQWSSYPGSSWTEAGAEKVYSYKPTTTGDYTFHGTQNSGDADFFLMSTPNNTGTCYASWDSGSKTVSLTANTTYYLIVDNYSSSESAGYTVSVDCYVPKYTVSFTTSPSGYGSVSPTSISNVPSGSSISVNGNKVTINGTTVTATAASQTAQYTYSFSNWSNTSGTITANRTITANFTRSTRQYTITWKNESGSSTLETDANQNYGATTAYNGSTPTKASTAQYDYTFDGWTTSANGGGTYYANGSTPTVSGAATYYAHFTATTRKYTITWKNEDGSTTLETDANQNYGATTAYNGSTPTKASTAQYNYTFDGWATSANGALAYANGSTPTVSGAATYYAHFTATTRSYAITATADPSNYGSVSGAGNYNYGASCTLVATPATNYKFVNWTKGGVQVSTNASYTFTVQEAGAYVAHFVEDVFTISATANPSAAGTVAGAGNYNSGETCTLTATVTDNAYEFVNWTKGGSVVSTNAEYGFTVSATTAGAYVANFSKKTYTINVVADPTSGGSVSLSGFESATTSATVEHGGSVTLYSQPANSNYVLGYWTLQGSEDHLSSDATYTVTNVQANATYVAHFVNSICYISAICMPNPSCGTVSGIGGYAYGGSCTLSVTANDGYYFTYWSKDAAGTQMAAVNPNWTIYPVISDGLYYAQFGTYSYTITATANPSNGGTVTGGGSYPYNSSCTLTASPAQGYQFVNWTLGQEVVSTNANYTFTVGLGNRDYVAHFAPTSSTIYATINDADGGEVSGGGTYQAGQTCTLYCTVNVGYHFDGWYKDNGKVSNDATYSFTPTSSGTYEARVFINEYEVAVSANPDNTYGTVTGGGTFEHGESCTVTAEAIAGHRFVNWTEGGVEVSTDATYTIESVTGPHNLVANFVNIYDITASIAYDLAPEFDETDVPDEYAVVSINGETAGTSVFATIDENNECIITASPGDDYEITTWYKDGVDLEHKNLSVTIESVDEAANYVVHFRKKQFIVGAEAYPGEFAGTVQGAETYQIHTMVTMMAEAADGYEFLYWTNDINDEEEYSPVFDFEVSGSINWTAHFGTRLTFVSTHTGATVYWDNPLNWAPTYEVLPTLTDNVTIKAPVIIPSSCVAQANQIGFDGEGSITIEDGGQLQHNAEGLVVNLQKHFDGYGNQNFYTNKLYHFFSTPTIDGLFPDQIADLITEDDELGHTFDFYAFDYRSIDEEWQAMENMGYEMLPGVGYMYANREDKDITIEQVEVNHSGVDKDFDLGFTTENAPLFNGWNLLGNPFVCDAYVTLSNGAEDYYTLNHATDKDEFVLTSIATPIHPMSGLFVKATDAGETVTYSRTASRNSSSLNINVSDNRHHGAIDVARVRFGNGAGLEKFQLNPNHTKVYIPQETRDYAVVYAEPAGEMPVNFKAEENGRYTLNFTTEEVSFNYLHLVDNLTGADVNLLDNPSYSFEAKTTDYASRFKLVFATGVNDDETFAFFSNGSFIINNDGAATLQVIDVTGRILSSESINGSCSKAINAAPGVYMLRLVNGDNVKVQKVVVR